MGQQERQSEIYNLKKFYTIHRAPLFWLTTEKETKRAIEWINVMDDAGKLGIIPNDQLDDQIRYVLKNSKTLSDKTKIETDQVITTMVLKFLKTLQEGNISFAYNEVSVSRDSIYVDQLLSSPKRHISKFVSKLDCKDDDYLTLKRYLRDSLSTMKPEKYKAVAMAMNYRRFLSINHRSTYILANIPDAEAIYYVENKPILMMRTVVGKNSKPTPIIAAYIASVVTFPYWNVPHSIAVKEILPKVQKDDNYLEQANLEVVNAKGNPIDDSDLDWKSYNAENFTYFFRQSTGADNSLGVLKFNMQNPFSIFLHSTSWQGVFDLDNRFLSHGCIRLEKPIDLANELLKGKLDIAQLKKGKENTEPKTFKLDVPVQTFIIYNPVVVSGKNITFLKDVYGLVK
ncbi:MAG: L,D-transpeptidase family protein [Bacteroidales bacterium]|nr:L,D-transpeptidase family protein [Bacteroidales bacterium]